MTNEEDLATKVAKKKAEIEHYKGVLSRWLGSRWYNQGERHLEDLEAELVALEIQHGMSQAPKMPTGKTGAQSE